VLFTWTCPGAKILKFFDLVTNGTFASAPTLNPPLIAKAKEPFFSKNNINFPDF
jgi:hypothetical protein